MADIKYTMPPPTEDTEQMCLFRWADAQSGKYPELSLMYHIPNGGKRGKAEAGRFRAMGVKSGVPDIFLPFAVQTFNFVGSGKEIAGKISLLQNPTPKNATVRHAIITGETGEYGGFQKNSRMKLSQRWLEKFGGADAEGAALGYEAAPFKVSERCCYYLKEKPCDDWAKEHNSVPYLGLMASEGGRREKSLMMHGCNYYGKSTIRSAPFAIFSRQDILQLALDLNVPIPAEYGEIVRDKDGTLRTTLAQRTGCTMCGFGIQLEQRPNRFDRLRSANPKEWEFWMRHVCRDENGDWYGWGRVLDYIGVEWENEPGQLPGQMSIEDYQT